jgi:CheY-like chemotaxis protein
MRIYSELGLGTTVKIYLPRQHGGDARPGHDAAPVAARPRAIGGETILVVEDDDMLRAHAVDILGELGYRVISAGDGQSALALLAREPDIDLLFTDVAMPGMNGRAVADEALRQRPRLKVLFTTGYTANAIIHHGRLDPGTELIGKPYSFADLAAHVRRLLDARQ